MPEYYITGTWNEWAYSPLMPDADANGIFSHRVQIGELGSEEFQIVLEKEKSKLMYPHVPQAELYKGMLCGPDAYGVGMYWLIKGKVGQWYEIVLDLKCDSGFEVVT